MIKHIILSFIILFSFCAHAQNVEFSKAILVSTHQSKDPIYDNIYNKCLNNLIKVLNPNVLLYNWDPIDEKVAFSSLNKHEEKPSNEVIYVYAAGYFNMDPRLEIATDKTGKTTGVYFVLECSLKYLCKHIDLATSKILLNDRIQILIPSVYKLHIKDYMQEFGNDPAFVQANSLRSYREIVNRLKVKYKDKIESFYQNEVLSQKAWSSLSSEVIEEGKDYFNVILPKEPGGKKAKTVKFNGGINDNLIIDDSYKVWAKRNIDDYIYYEELALVYVDSIGEKESTASKFLFSSKDLASALNNKEELVMVPADNTAMINRLNKRPEDPTVNIAIRKKCIFCLADLEQSLNESAVFVVVERNAPELKYFHKLAKNDNFIDYSVEDLQGQQLGYELLMVENDKYFQVVDAATNINIASFEKKYNRVEYSNNGKPYFYKYLSIRKSDIQRLLTAYNPEVYKVDWIKTLKEKKNEINKILVFHPGGMNRDMEYNFYTEKMEQVDGVNIARKNKIGRGITSKSISPNIAELNIKDGEKEVFNAHLNKEKIIIEVSDKSLN